MNSSQRFAERLREAREEKRLNQEEFASLGGVKKGAQGLYETGKSSPNTEYLFNLARHGIDISYLLTGERKRASEDDRLFRAIHALSERERKAIGSLVGALANDDYDYDEFIGQIEWKMIGGNAPLADPNCADTLRVAEIANSPLSSDETRKRAKRLLEHHASVHKFRR